MFPCPATRPEANLLAKATTAAFLCPRGVSARNHPRAAPGSWKASPEVLQSTEGEFTTHDLRRTVATMVAEMGIALELVSRWSDTRRRAERRGTLVRHYVPTDLVERKKTVLEAWRYRLREIIDGQNARGNVTRLVV